MAFHTPASILQQQRDSKQYERPTIETTSAIRYIEPVDSTGRVYRNFYAAQSMLGTGWFVYGVAVNVSARVTMKVAEPNQPARKSVRFNGKVQFGWKTKREADRYAAEMNEAYPANEL